MYNCKLLLFCLPFHPYTVESLHGLEHSAPGISSFLWWTNSGVDWLRQCALMGYGVVGESPTQVVQP